MRSGPYLPPHHHSLLPASTRRVILSLIFSSGIAESDPKPVSVPMASTLLNRPSVRTDYIIALPKQGSGAIRYLLLEAIGTAAPPT